MTPEDRMTLITSTGIGIGHVVLVFGLLNWTGYPLVSFAGTAVPQLTFLSIGLFLVAFVPVLIFARVRLVIPLAMGTIGLAITIAASLATPDPAFTMLGENILIVGTSYVNVYANGWYVWLLAYVLGGVGEYVVRPPADGLFDSLKFSSWSVRLDRKRSVLLGCVVGSAHTVVIITLGIGHEGALLSGWLLEWGLFGLLLLGSLPLLFLIRYQLIAPLAGLITIQLTIGVETLATISDTPVSSYMLFWPVYLGHILLLGIGESAFRWGHRKVTVYRQTVQSTDR